MLADVPNANALASSTFVRGMKEDMRRKAHRWAIILEDGDRMRTRMLSYKDARQHEGGESSLKRTAKQISRFVPPEHHVAVPTTDCGSLPMVLWSLLRLAHLDPEAASGIFVAGQSHENESGFGQAVSDAFRLVQIKLCRNSVILLGASLKDGEAEGGWIEPKPSILGCSGGAVRPVLRLWNRPSPETRHELGQRG